MAVSIGKSFVPMVAAALLLASGTLRRFCTAQQTAS